LAQKARDDLLSNLKINAAVRDRLLVVANQKIAQLQEARQKAIAEQLNFADQTLAGLLEKGLINSLDYDIIKANNNYLKNNL